MTEKETDQRNKIILVGGSSTGKTSILNRFSYGKFDETIKPTINFDVFHEKVTLKDETTHDIFIWDTCGTDLTKSIAPSYYRDAVCAIITFSVNNKESFDELEYWTGIVKVNAHPTIPIVICATKTDCECLVPIEQGEKYARDNGYPFITCCSKTGENVRELFELAMECVLKSDYCALKKVTYVDISKEKEDGCCVLV